MVVLDASIVNIALPHAALALHIQPKNDQWAVTAYTLTFGGFLLLGGRIADYLGRKRVFVIGLGGFALASLLGGLSVNQGMLFGARALQGLFGALLAPAALSLVSVTFTDSKERAKAFAVYGAISGVGAAIGLISGGTLVQYANWRWCLFVNTPMAVLAIVLAIPNIRESRVQGETTYDVPGAITATLGMVAMVYGVSQASTDGWSSRTALLGILGGLALLVLFVIIENKVANPLLPLRLVNRIRGGAYISQMLAATGLFGMFFFMTFYFQNVHQYSAVKSGLCFLPFSLGIITSATAASKLLPKFGPRGLASGGLLLAASGLYYLSTFSATSSYVAHIMPAMIVMSLGLGSVFVSMSSTALFNTPFHDVGAASALLNASQQVGGSFGTALQNTIAVSATSSMLLPVHLTTTACQNLSALAAGGAHVDVARLHHCLVSGVHGYSSAFRFGSLVLALAGVIFFAMVNIDRHHLTTTDGAQPVAH
jgi:EmrB/QacA subfamily drug resistance transporter